MANSKISVKLFVDNKEQRVLFAEAGKDFVDFLFSLLVIPVGSIVGMLEENKGGDVVVGGSFAKLRKSVSDLNKDYILHLKKNVLLQPKSSLPSFSQRLLRTGSLKPSLASSPRPRSTNTRRYSESDSSSTDDSSDDEQDSDSSSDENRGGFVKGSLTYTVTDDLVVSPMPTVSKITNFLKSFGIKNLGDIEEKVVNIGQNEALGLLKRSMYSKTVLTDVLLASKVVVKDENRKRPKRE